MLPDGNVIAPTAKAFDVEFAQTSKWEGGELIIVAAFWDAACRPSNSDSHRNESDERPARGDSNGVSRPNRLKNSVLSLRR